MASRKIVFWEVDAQADFVLPGGKLYVPGAEKIIPNIQRLVSAAAKAGVFLVSSGDAHPENDPEFQRFPPHCLRGTPGARIIPQGLGKDFLAVPNDASRKLPVDALHHPQVVIEKQTLDVFDNPHTSEIVDRLGPEAEYVVFGVVTEYCVKCAAKGLLDRGRKVSIAKDAIESLKPEDGRRALDELRAAGARLITTDEALKELHAAVAR
ncbi:MAG TPA: isochorismatase family cysteine hydrolase [Candidatus Acidoferrales bacterium]|nr:isochorismatase family cysteine hydrolase [Candidatus Acidoferrales bacterium]